MFGRFRRLFIFIAVVLLIVGGVVLYQNITGKRVLPWGGSNYALWLRGHPAVTPHIGTVTGTGSSWSAPGSQEDAVKEVVQSRVFTDTRCGREPSRNVKSLVGREGTAELHVLSDWKTNIADIGGCPVLELHLAGDVIIPVSRPRPMLPIRFAKDRLPFLVAIPNKPLQIDRLRSILEPKVGQEEEELMREAAKREIESMVPWRMRGQHWQQLLVFIDEELPSQRYLFAAISDPELFEVIGANFNVGVVPIQWDHEVVKTMMQRFLPGEMRSRLPVAVALGPDNQALRSYSLRRYAGRKGFATGRLARMLNSWAEAGEPLYEADFERRQREFEAKNRPRRRRIPRPLQGVKRRRPL